MASNPRREELAAEIKQLRKESEKFLREGREEQAVFEKRRARIAQLIRELEALDDGKHSHPSC